MEGYGYMEGKIEKITATHLNICNKFVAIIK